jgi:hypothetical protein
MARRPTTPSRTPGAAQPSEQAATRPRAPRAKTAASVTVTVPDPAAPLAATVSVEARRAMIAQAAYLRAERRGFASGGEVEDWLAAEAEIDALLKAGTSGPPQ